MNHLNVEMMTFPNKLCYHRWVVADSQKKWEYQECSKCGKRRTIEKILGGFQPKKHPNWDK